MVGKDWWEVAVNPRFADYIKLDPNEGTIISSIDDDYVEAYADEGIGLRKNGLQLPIMVMNPTISSLPSMIEYDLQPAIYNFQLLKAYALLAVTGPIPGIHLKIDTGMHRLGFQTTAFP